MPSGSPGMPNRLSLPALGLRPGLEPWFHVMLAAS